MRFLRDLRKPGASPLSALRGGRGYLLSALAALALAAAFLPGIGRAGGVVAPDTQGNVGRFTALALDRSNRPIIAYHDLSKRSLKLLRCRDAGCQGEPAGTAVVLDSDGLVGTYTSLALGRAGGPVVSYHDATKGTLKLVHCQSADCTKRSISAPDAASQIVGKHTSLALDGKGNPAVSYYDASNGDLKLLRCSDAECSGDQASNITVPDATGDVGLYTSLALDSAGNPVISYYGSGQGLKVLHCDDPNCTGDESANISLVDKGEVGWFTSLRLDRSGNPVISYQDFATGDLKVLHCDDPMCAGDESANISVADAKGTVGAYTSLVLDERGLPVISYYDASQRRLKLLHCDDPNCAGDEADNISMHEDGDGEAGLYTSVALDAGGNPVVSYYDASNGDLKLLRCLSPECRDPSP